MPQDSTFYYALRHPNPTRRREAIVGVARQGLVEALPILRELAQNDHEAELRELAGKAIRHLQKHQDSTLIDPLGFDQAQRQLTQAYQTYREQGAEAASPIFSAALKLDPDLAEEPGAKRLSQALKQAQPSLERDRPSENRGWRTVRRRSRFQWAMVGVLGALLLLLFFRTGVFDTYIGSLVTHEWRENLRQNDTGDYYLFVPDAPEPPSGWGILVVLHEYSYDAESLLPLFVERARNAGVILVAPTFGEYPQPLALEPLSRLDSILIQVRNTYRTDDAGVVVFGYGVGGEVAMLYARDYYGVGAVATYGTSVMYPPPSDDGILPYLIMYGEYDSLRGMLEQELNQFEGYPNPTEIITIPDADKNLSEGAVELVVQLTQQLYQVR